MIENQNQTRRRYYSASEPTEPVARLIRLLSFHTEWKLGEFTLDHISGLKLWHCNGISSLYVRDPEYVGFTLLEKFRLRRHVKRCMRMAGSDRVLRLGKILDEA